MSESTTMPEIIDVDSDPPSAAPITPARMPDTAPAALFGTSDPVEVLEKATAVAKALVGPLEDHQLYKVIRSRKHIFIEGWLTLAGMLSVSTPNEWVRELVDDDGKSLGWEARYQARAIDGRLLSSAEGECRYAEETWATRDSHALRSMAQTRAQSKALASALRWIVELAGFSGTPAEEMGGNDNAASSFKCPACESGVWDNRETNVQREADKKPAMPAFKCKNRECVANDGEPWISWSSSFFLDPVTKAKQAMVDLVLTRKPAWKLYFPLDDPSYTEAEAALIQTAHESDDSADMAGILWSGLVHDEDERSLAIMLEAVETLLERILTDSDDVLSLEEAWNIAEEVQAQSDADAAVGTTDYH